MNNTQAAVANGKMHRRESIKLLVAIWSTLANRKPSGEPNTKSNLYLNWTRNRPAWSKPPATPSRYALSE